MNIPIRELENIAYILGRAKRVMQDYEKVSYEETIKDIEYELYKLERTLKHKRNVYVR